MQPKKRNRPFSPNVSDSSVESRQGHSSANIYKPRATHARVPQREGQGSNSDQQAAPRQEYSHRSRRGGSAGQQSLEGHEARSVQQRQRLVSQTVQQSVQTAGARDRTDTDRGFPKQDIQ